MRDKSPDLYWPLLLWFNSNLKAILLQFWNSAWRWERNPCDVKKTNGQVSVGDLQTQLFCVYTKHSSPISSKSLSNCREMNQKSLVAYKEELNSHLRHTYRDECDELAPISSLGNMSFAVNYPFLSNYLRNQTRTRILSNKTKCTACRSLACSICFKWKKKRQIDRKVL